MSTTTTNLPHPPDLATYHQVPRPGADQRRFDSGEVRRDGADSEVEVWKLQCQRRCCEIAVVEEE